MTGRKKISESPDLFSAVVAFDFETTGLDPENDEILEVGIVRIEADGSESRYSQLVDPAVPIPRTVTLLTGIRQEDVSGMPGIGDVLPEVTRLLDGPFWVTAHNADFDRSFLAAAVSRHGKGLPLPESGRVIDTLDLSRILYPWLPNHRLETVASHLGLAEEAKHRAANDAALTGRAFRKMIPSLLELDSFTVDTVNRILNGAHDGLRFLFERLAAAGPKTATAGPRPIHWISTNVLGRRDDANRSEAAFIDVKTVDAFFEPGGALSARLPEFELREPQKRMAAAVAKSLNEDGFLAAEAGTGVGKSLAYLMPAALWAIGHPDERVVVATHTKTLQDQLFFKDLPLVARAMDSPFLAVLLKGRGNYLCIERFRGLLERLEEKLDRSERKLLLPLVLWSGQTRTGDIDENNGFVRASNESLWSLLQADAASCRSPHCPNESGCFVQRIHRAAKSAGLVVVNHALLFSSIAQNRSALGSFETLIVDEAHQMEKSASQYLGVNFEPASVHDLLHRLHAVKPRVTGLAVTLRSTLKEALSGDADLNAAADLLDRLTDSVRGAAETAALFFRDVAAEYSPPASGNGLSVKPRIRIRDVMGRRMPAAFESAERGLDGLRRALSDCLSQFRTWELDTRAETEGAVRELDSALGRVEELFGSLVHFRDADLDRFAVWVEFPGSYQAVRRGRVSPPQAGPALHSVPIEIAGTLAERLFPAVKRAVFTSATLTVDDRFDYTLGRWGLDRAEPERCTARVFGSPFDFRRQALLAVPTFLPDPRNARYTGEISSLLRRLLTSHGRGTLVLFTSYAMLREVYAAVRPVLEEKGIRLLGQGVDGSRSFLLKVFQEDVRSVLFGTSSFWEGVDVPGEALELLVITKIPFDVPTDPLIEARMERVQANTGNGFMNYAVPEAVVRLRQGFGRLIRTAADRGAVLVLDPRMTRTAYGSQFLNSLPVAPTTCDDEQSLFAVLDKWF
jgi:Rad3-related DNA helicase/DNA polymerase III epsilon subunit-like protein